MSLHTHTDLKVVHWARINTDSAHRSYKPGLKFTDDLRTILRQFSDLRQS